MRNGDIVTVKDWRGAIWQGRVVPDSDIPYLESDPLFKVQELEGARSVYLFESSLRVVKGEYLSEGARKEILGGRLRELQEKYGIVFPRVERYKNSLEISFTVETTGRYRYTFAEGKWTGPQDPDARAFFDSLLEAGIVGEDGAVNLEFGEET